MYYKPENEFALEDAKERIEATLKEALENSITKEEYTAMRPDIFIYFIARSLVDNQIVHPTGKTSTQPL